MDGYALACTRALGASSAPVTLPVLGTIFAGDAPRRRAESGAWKIMTGAPIPAGCDAVVPLEQARELDGGRAVEILRTRTKAISSGASAATSAPARRSAPPEPASAPGT